MRFGVEDVSRHAGALGFRPDSLEKVFRLLSLLETVCSSAFLRPRVVLKGGTALNLFVLDVPRLSVDIDLNYVGAADRETTLAERPKVEQAIQAACAREGLAVRRVPTDHAGGKWRLTYTSLAGSSGQLEIDLNYLVRVPLWPANPKDSRAFGPVIARGIPIVERHELAAGKLAALCARRASRDLFDAREILTGGFSLDPERLRLAFVVNGGASRTDWRTVSVEDVDARPEEIERSLLPMLRAAAGPADGDVARWTTDLVRETRALMSQVLPLADSERDFLERLNGEGMIIPELLTSDGALQERIRAQPGLRWKARNVRAHLGLSARDDDPVG